MLYTLFSLTTLVLSFLLGLYVYQNDKKNPVNKIFILLLLSAMFWIFSNFLVDISEGQEIILFWSKVAIIGPILIAYFFYRLSLYFPRKNYINEQHEKVLIVVVGVLSLLSLTKLNVESISFLANNIPAIHPGPLYPFFLAYFVCLLGFALKNLYQGYSVFSKLEKLQVQYISLGLGISAILGTILDGILPILGDLKYANLGPYAVLFFIAFTFYSILKFKMFDIKIITTQLVVFSLWIFIFIRMLVSENMEDRIINAGLLTLLLTFGTLLIKSVIKEVSQREKIELLAADLQKANDRLRELDKQKSEFVSFATHQLRAPLTAMKGYASLILEGDLGKLSREMKGAITRIYDSANTLANIVDDYLNISRIELGSMKYSFETVDLKELLDHVIGELRPNLEKSKLKFDIVVDREKKYLISVDKDKFKQIIANLVDNAIKYTPVGTVTVSITKRKEGTDPKIMFSVKDNGIGIAAEVLPKLFAKFTRADNGSRQNIHGTGLGLYVAKEIVTAHKGRIWAESPGEGKGSTFFVELEEII